MSRVEELDFIKALRGGLAAIQNILDHAEGLGDAQKSDQVDVTATLEIIDGLNAGVAEIGHFLLAEPSHSARKPQAPANFNGKLRGGSESRDQVFQRISQSIQETF